MIPPSAKTPEQEAREIIASIDKTVEDFDTPTQRIVKLGKAGMDALIEGIVRPSPQSNSDLFCAWALGAYGDEPEAKAALISALEYAPSVSQRAGWNLADWCNERDVPLLVEQMNAGQKGINVQYYADLLARINSESANQALMGILKDETLAFGHDVALLHFMKIGYSASLEYFLAKLAKHIYDPDRNSPKEQTLNMLPNYNQGEMTEAASKWLFSSRGLQDKCAAFEALVRCGAELAIPILIKLVKKLAKSKVLSDDDSYLLLKSVQALGNFHSKAAAAVRPLISAMKVASDATQIEIVRSLGQIGDKSAEPFLFECTKNTDGSIRFWAICSLMDVGSQAVYPLTLPLLMNNIVDVRDRFVDYALRTGLEQQAIAWLTIQMNDSPSERFFAFGIITKLRQKRAASRAGVGTSSISFEGLDLKQFPAKNRTRSFSNTNIHKHVAGAKKVLA